MKSPVYDHNRLCVEDEARRVTTAAHSLTLPQEQDWRAAISSLLDSLLWMTLGKEIKELEW